MDPDWGRNNHRAIVYGSRPFQFLQVALQDKVEYSNFKCPIRRASRLSPRIRGKGKGFQFT